MPDPPTHKKNKQESWPSGAHSLDGDSETQV